jgi:hypothetical protein
MHTPSVCSVSVCTTSIRALSTRTEYTRTEHTLTEYRYRISLHGSHCSTCSYKHTLTEYRYRIRLQAVRDLHAVRAHYKHTHTLTEYRYRILSERMLVVLSERMRSTLQAYTYAHSYACSTRMLVALVC